jgi:hypothetical protein
MWDIILRSGTTISTLSINLCNEESYFCLLNVHFPQLRSLTIGMWKFDTGPQMPSSPDFTDFILNHDTIEVLDIFYDGFGIGRLLLDDSSLPRLQADSLPRLRSFRGTPYTFEVMAQARMSCLRTTLTQLFVDPVKVYDSTLEIERMFDAVLFSNVGSGTGALRLSALKEIQLDMSEMTCNNALEFIRQCARCCGDSLEVWRGHLPKVKMDVKVIAELFGQFERIRSIHLLEQTLIGHSFSQMKEDHIKASVSTIASSCLELREVMIVQRMFPRMNQQWTVVRTLGPKGKMLCSVIRHVDLDVAAGSPEGD